MWPILTHVAHYLTHVAHYLTHAAHYLTYGSPLSKPVNIFCHFNFRWFLSVVSIKKFIKKSCIKKSIKKILFKKVSKKGHCKKSLIHFLYIKKYYKKQCYKKTANPEPCSSKSPHTEVGWRGVTIPFTLRKASNCNQYSDISDKH